MEENGDKKLILYRLNEIAADIKDLKERLSKLEKAEIAHEAQARPWMFVVKRGTEVLIAAIIGGLITFISLFTSR